MSSANGLDVRLYVVTDPALTPADRLAEMCVAAVRGGATLVQLRDKKAPDGELAAMAAGLARALAPWRVPLVVNDRLDVAAATGSGVHLGVHDATPAQARARLGHEAIVGLSVEAPEQLDPERIDPASLAACSYLAASPVCETPTKIDTLAPLGLAGVTAIRRRSTVPLVGIGGINTPQRAAEVIAAGAAGVAVVSGVFAAPDPQEAARALRAAVDDALARRRDQP
ncbi:thiamine phosphate synthase [Actinobacteria bacterium YIM 96077]|uniref:Thiamine-phosphate synthase n=1 Tax=Phytoactinopolyspora halophila TaxID=1981511 RepID=A0A329QE15_9ACTN|nr:thiamine phosphate synthase [Phytoactinopolyspora halophila]AYY15319.1 thiamine phosphate synthase [Actinobacteria bacterium YIM 96077]RAW09452.1 thiamine phosphate synthase [Phytoactinopolyspora halophila]